ncbi:MAG: Asp-tRNA(Asn)/Glu-tRNA(Gln) amidotransferase subunit GatC [Candidatus Dormibacteria bacterium]
MTELSHEEVRHVARLARLGLTEEEVAYFAGQLSHILGHIERMSELDTDGVPPTAQTTGLTNVFRPDRVVPPLSREAALANAPDSDGESFLVKGIQD